MFWAPCGSGGGGVGGWGGDGWGCPHTCAHAHAHTSGKHNNFMQMAAPIGGIPGNSLWCHMHMHVHAHVYMCMCLGCTLSPPPPPSTHSHPPGDPRNHSKFNSTWTNRDISILVEDLKSVETPPPMGGCIIWWGFGLMGGVSQITKNLKIVDWIKIIQFCLKIYDL